LVLVDTPGINDAAGELRGKLAEETVRYTDLVLFVADGDLNRVEVEALKQLCDLHKPMLLVIHKADGTIEIISFQPKPKIDALEARMLEVLDREGKAIIALNASLFASDVS